MCKCNCQRSGYTECSKDAVSCGVDDVERGGNVVNPGASDTERSEKDTERSEKDTERGMVKCAFVAPYGSGPCRKGCIPDVQVLRNHPEPPELRIPGLKASPSFSSPFLDSLRYDCASTTYYPTLYFIY